MIGCSELELDVAVREEECKPIVVAVSSDIYPVFWIGEKTPPGLYGWGRLVLVEFGDGSESCYVKRVAVLLSDSDVGEDPCGREVIFIGGVFPTLVRVKKILRITRDEEHAIPSLLVPSGIGYKTYAVVGERVVPKMRRLENGKLEVYSPPYLYWVVIENGEVRDVRKIVRNAGG